MSFDVEGVASGVKVDESMVGLRKTEGLGDGVQACKVFRNLTASVKILRLLLYVRLGRRRSFRFEIAQSSFEALP